MKKTLFALTILAAALFTSCGDEFAENEVAVQEIQATGNDGNNEGDPVDPDDPGIPEQN